MNDHDIARLVFPLLAGLDRPQLPGTSDDWLTLASRHRLIPLLAWAHRRNFDDLDEALRNAERQELTNMVMVEAQFVEALDLLSEAGIQPVVLKGLATAHLDYPTPAMRQFGDADLLVQSNQLDLAVLRLREAGWTPKSEVPSRHSEIHAIAFKGPLERDLDLHIRLGRRAVGVLLDPVLFGTRTQQFEIAGRCVLAPDRPLRLIHAAVHHVASRDRHKRLSGLADVLVIAENYSEIANETLQLAADLRVGYFVDTALAEAYACIGQPIRAEWSDGRATPHGFKARLIERSYAADRRHPVLEEAAHFSVSTNRTQYLRHVVSHLKPDELYRVRFDRQSSRSQFRYLLRKLRSR